MVLRKAFILAPIAVLIALPAGAARFEARRTVGKTLFRLAAEADAIVTGKVVGVGTLYSVPSEFAKRAPRVKVAKTVKGPVQPGELITFIYRADLARGYRNGDDVLLFLKKTAADPMFQGIQTARWVDWYNPTSGRAKIELTPDNRQALLAPIARYAALGRESVESAADGLRGALVDDLGSPSRLVARDALDELAGTPGLGDGLSAAEVGAIGRIAASKSADPYVRAGLIRLLAERPEGAAQLLALFKADLDGRLKIELLDAAAERRLRETAPAAVALLQSRDGPLREAAARALGAVGDQRAVEPLAALAERDPNPAIRATAVRAIGAIGGAAGKSRLEQIAAQHPDRRIREVASRLDGRI